MENLPFVVLKKLFKLLVDSNDLVNCSLVCQTWKAAYDTIPKPGRLFLHFEPFVPLNYQLFYSNEAVVESGFLQIPKDLQFLHSPTAKIHFANIQKLVIFDPGVYSEETRIRDFSFQKQLNHFASLEHFEMHHHGLRPVDFEINLPKLKILNFSDCELASESSPILLNTPRLEALRVYTDKMYLMGTCTKIWNFKFAFPHQLKHLVMINPGNRFKFDSHFANLECLIIGTDGRFEFERRYQQTRKLGDGFLESLPSLKYLFVHPEDVDSPNLQAEKLEFKLDDLQIFDYDEDYPLFDDVAWHRNVQHRPQLRYWPGEFEANFAQMLKIPWKHFEENYLKIGPLIVRQVTSQSLLIDFLRKVKIERLTLVEEFNLGQGFFDEVASFLTIENLESYESTWRTVSDLSVLSRLNFRSFDLHYEQLPRQVALAVLQKASCSHVNFSNESRPDDGPVCHSIQARPDKRQFSCAFCRWDSANDPNCSQDPIAGTIRHIESERLRPNFSNQKNGLGELKRLLNDHAATMQDHL